MKRDSLLMLVAGIVLGAVLSFVATRQYYAGKKLQAVAAPAAKPSFDKSQHQAMIARIMAYIADHPNDVQKRTMLANIFYDKGDFDKAAPLYEQVLKLTPRDTNVMVDLGTCYRRLGRADDALALYDKALEVEPNKKQALFNKAVVYAFDKKDKARALKTVDLLRKDYPDEPAVKTLRDQIEREK